MRVYGRNDLCSMPQCPTVCPPTYGPKFVCVQQPPQVVCKKKVVYCNRTVIDKHVVPQTKCITEPKLIYEPKTVWDPCVIYKKRTIQQPKVVYYKKIVPDPKVVCRTRIIQEPKEICETMVCRPKPQKVQVPPPKAYVCTTTGTKIESCPSGPCGPGDACLLPYGACGPCDPSPSSCNPCVKYC